MKKQSKTQKQIMHDVMHDYKLGDLQSSSGLIVKSRKQAIAIGLHEAGASKYETPARNKRNLQRTKQKAQSARKKS
ncbi:MAG: DUF6496 domain-containing protein [Alphaproteobacteria bacterium]|nr:DUF6496 domain-containing protein [Alphaproteobacteria bacterium]